MTNNEFSNFTFDVFDCVADDATKARRRLEALREGTARPGGLDHDAVLKLYRQKLLDAVAEIDKVLN